MWTGVIFVQILLLFGLTACGGGHEDNGANSVPSVKVECSSADVGDCSANTKVVYVGIIENLAMDCGATMHGLDSAQRQLLFTVSGQAVSTRSGIYLMATVNSWFNSTGGNQDTLNEGSYRVCSFVDSNANGQLDTTEPVSSSQISAGDAQHTLSIWIVH